MSEHFVEILTIGDNPTVELIPINNIEFIKIHYADNAKKVKRMSIDFTNNCGCRSYTSEKTECDLYNMLP